MTDQPGISEEYRSASPWPLFVALGFALAEVGVFLGVFSVAVGGLLLLGASVTGILRESGRVTRTWRVLGGLGVAFALLGVAVVATQVSPASVAVRDVVSDPGGIVGRGLSIVVAGVILGAAAVAGGVADATDA